MENLAINGYVPTSALTTDPNATNPYAGALGVYFGAFTYNDQDILIKNVYVKHTAMAIHIKGATGVTLDSVEVRWNGIAYLEHNAYIRRVQNVNIINSKFDESLAGAGLHIADASSSDITITGGEFNNNAGQGMNIQDTPTNMSVKGALANYNGGDGIAATGTNLVIDGNQSKNNATDGIHTFAGSGSVTNNVSTGNGGYDLDIHGTFTVSGNTTS